MDKNTKYRNSLLNGLSKKTQANKEVVKEIENTVAKWLFPFYERKSMSNAILSPKVISNGNEEEIENELIFKLFTSNNEYTFLIIIDFKEGKHFMEASVKNRKPNPGQEKSSSKVLPNGELSDELWNQLKDCVLKHELLEITSSDWKNY